MSSLLDSAGSRQDIDIYDGGEMERGTFSGRLLAHNGLQPISRLVSHITDVEFERQLARLLCQPMIALYL